MPWLFAVALAATVSEPVKSCDILHAHYSAPGKPEYRLRFVKLASAKDVVSDLGLHIYSADPKAELWYYPDEGLRLEYP